MELTKTLAYQQIIKLNDPRLEWSLDDMLDLQLSESEWPHFWDAYLMDYQFEVNESQRDIVTGIPAFQYATEGQLIEAFKKDTLQFYTAVVIIYENIKSFTYTFQNMAWTDYINYRPKKQMNLKDYQNKE